MFRSRKTLARPVGRAGLALTAAAVVGVGLAPAATAAPTSSLFTGVVKGTDGRPLAGVGVSADHIDGVAGFPIPSVTTYGTAVTRADGSTPTSATPVATPA